MIFRNGRNAKRLDITIKELSYIIEVTLIIGLIMMTTGSFLGAVWANDNQHIFYSVKDETLRPVKIYRHKLGTSSTEDVLIYSEKDDTFSAFVYKTKSKKYIVGALETRANGGEVKVVDLVLIEHFLLNANPESAVIFYLLTFRQFQI